MTFNNSDRRKLVNVHASMMNVAKQQTRLNESKRYCAMEAAIRIFMSTAAVSRKDAIELFDCESVVDIIMEEMP